MLLQSFYPRHVKIFRMRTIEFKNNRVYLIDQTLLPAKLKVVECRTAEDVAKAIEQMKIRGAPAIGVAGAMALALAALRSRGKSRREILADLEKTARRLKKTRPTAVSLFSAIDRVLTACKKAKDVRGTAVSEACRIAEEDIDKNRRIGENGEKLIQDGSTILTHCNAGALATVDYGTALGVVRACVEKGKRVQVIATETRPLLQGARLTAWELKREGIPVKVIVDGAAGYAMSRGEVDVVIVGADRIAANGDTANKIGTYALSVLSKENGIPFYVAAPSDTFDFSIRSGEEIPIEERSPDEVARLGRVRIIPRGIQVWNPAFDVTPASNITAFITELGVFRPKEIGRLRRRTFCSPP